MKEVVVLDNDNYLRSKRDKIEAKQAVENYKKRILKNIRKYDIDIKIECRISKGYHIDGLIFFNKKKVSIRCKDISKFIYYIHRTISDKIHIVEENRPVRDIVHIYDCA